MAAFHMNRLLRQGWLLFAFVTNLSAFEPPEPTILFTNFASLNTPQSVVTADLDGDGQYDALTVIRLSPYWNIGTNFQSGMPLNYDFDNQAPFPPVPADFDNDGDLDLLLVRLSGVNRRATTIFWNRGNRSFTNSPQTIFPQISYGSAAAGDYDNDGDLDFVITGNTNAPNSTVGRNITKLYENLGRGSFVEVPQNFRNVEDGVASWADYDRDGDLDLLVTGYLTNINSASSRLYRNDRGVFEDSGLTFPSFVKDSPEPIVASWGDYDNDHDLDLLMIGSTLTGGRRAFAQIFNNVDGTFTNIPLALTNTPSSLRGTWVDLNGDGDLDLIVGRGSGAGSSILVNDGTGTFGAPMPAPYNSAAYHPAFFDQDDLTDLLWDKFDFFPRALRNVTAGTNTPPNAPDSLNAVQIGGSVAFSWNAAHDAEQSALLTYNLRVGTTPGGSEIMSAMANPATGRRYIAALGNTGLRTNWTLRNFQTGTYFWSVQAIDHGYVGSLFAAEQSFTISNAPPVIEMFSLTNASPNSVTASFRLNPNDVPTEYYLVFTSSNESGTNVITLRDGGGVQLEHLLLANLLPSTTYEVRVVASNQFGVAESSPRRVSTLPPAPLTEIPLPFSLLAQDSSILAADMDQNGYFDVVVSGMTNNVRTNRVFLNTAGVLTEGAPSFLLGPPVFSTTIYPKLAGDFNNDGRIDLVFGNQQTAAIYTAMTNGFRFLSYVTGASVNQLFVRDLDTDGDLDLLYPSFHSAGLLRAAANTGIGLEYPGLDWQSRVPALEWGDYDNDGDDDFLGFGSTNQSFDFRSAVTHVFRNEGAYTFTNINAGLPGSLFGAAWADYDNDRDLDVALLLSSNSLNPSVEIYFNAGSNRFEKADLNLPTFESLVAIDWLDFNRDWRPDLILQQDLPTGDLLRVFLSTGANQFVEHALNIPTNIHYETVFADFDGDRLPDILLNTTTNRTQFRPRLFRNNLLSTTPAASAPANLVAVAAQSSVQLSWQAPTNDTENLVAYSFNIRLGKTPGGSEIVSAMSDRVTGARHLPQRGNAGQSGTWNIRDLPPGTYYWSVQSVDHAFNGSPFAPEATFQIGPQDRTPRILAFHPSSDGTYSLTIDAPTRSNIILETSTDLIEWLPTKVFYIGSEPRTITVNNSGESALFFRFDAIE